MKAGGTKRKPKETRKKQNQKMLSVKSPPSSEVKRIGSAHLARAEKKKRRESPVIESNTDEIEKTVH